MFEYHLRCALHKSLRRPWLASTLILIIGLGAAACMTTLSVLRAATRDPMPGLSQLMYAPSIMSRGQAAATLAAAQGLVDHATAMRLLTPARNVRVLADYAISGIALPQRPGTHPTAIYGHAVSTGFFSMLHVPLVFGGAWSAADEDRGDLLVVISEKLNNRIFGGRNSVGETLRYNDSTLRVVGVMGEWEPSPRFYDVNVGNGYPGTDEDFFVPFASALANEFSSSGTVSCVEAPRGGGLHALIDSRCLWISVIAETQDKDAIGALSEVLDSTVKGTSADGTADSERSGTMIPLSALLERKNIVPAGTHASVVVAIALFLGCLITAASLMLSNYLGRTTELGLRRALGAKRQDILGMLLVESALIGILGGLIGVALTLAGVAAVHRLLPSGPAELATFQFGALVLTMLGTLVATVLAGCYPAMTASRVLPYAAIKQG
ncbi:ABC transporter permease [Dyella sp. KULCS107]|uniref:ABC transporter permease n=1 Tax=Dyella sp. KULCS107 TaxID=3422216 RepID=UPI003D6F6750